MKYLIISIWQVIMKTIYFFFKLLKTKNKITFMSRQTNTRNIDFDMIIEEIKKQDNTIEIKVLNKEIGKGFKAKLEYTLHMFKQMYHIATSKVIIIDSYAILISILNHKKDTTVIQIWHSMGALKKFGYSILGQKEGRDEKLARIMKMHKNNDYILTSSSICKKHFKEAFNTNEEQIVVLGLPRIDFLRSKSEKDRIKKEIYQCYTEINNEKENILYIPTMRIGKKIDINPVKNSIDYTKYNLIIKLHNGKEIIYSQGKKIEKMENFLGIELLHIADYIITDYSAVCYEAALLNKPIYFYVYDYDQYLENRGFYIDFHKEMPGVISKDINEIINSIEKKIWFPEKIKQFSNKYIENNKGNITKEIVKFIVEVMKQ